MTTFFLQKQLQVFLLITIILGTSYTGFSQLEEGKIVYKETTTSPDFFTRAKLKMLGDINIVGYFKKNKLRILVYGTIVGNTITTINLDANEQLILMDNYVSGKKYIKSDIKVKKEAALEIVKTNETKTILGYECIKYTIETKNSTIKMYLTNDIKSAAFEKIAFNNKIEGVPLLIEVDIKTKDTSISMKVKASSVEKKSISDSKYDIVIPEGYTETTVKELEKPKGT